MKFSVGSQTLAAALGLSAQVVDTKATASGILANVRIDAFKGSLAITATDLTITSHQEINAEVSSSCVACVEAAALLDLAKGGGGEMQFSLDADGGWMTVTSGHAVVCLPTWRSDLFPSIEMPELDAACEVSPSLMLGAISAVDYCTGDNSRLTLAGVHVEVGKKLISFAASDGARLAYAEAKGRYKGGVVMLASDRFCAALRKLGVVDGDWQIGRDANKAWVKSGRTILMQTVYDLNFPNVQGVLSQLDTPVRIEVDGESLRSAARRALAFSDKSGDVLLAISGKRLKISTESQRGSFSDEIECGEGEASVTLAARYFADTISTIATARIAIGVGDAHSAILVEPVDSERTFDARHVLMPIFVTKKNHKEEK
ncbi:MAG: hypothetical protein WC538_21995 [Thermoanaerobaculia bacterium]|jgi:DNA polymerase III sliding clamp (beta) subunit (PCNA family)